MKTAEQGRGMPGAEEVRYMRGNGAERSRARWARSEALTTTKIYQHTACVSITTLAFSSPKLREPILPYSKYQVLCHFGKPGFPMNSALNVDW